MARPKLIIIDEKRDTQSHECPVWGGMRVALPTALPTDEKKCPFCGAKV